MTRLLQLFEGRNVAIVGNGNVREDVSSEIDAADVVVRFNHFYNYDSNKVGKRVDVIFQTVTKQWWEAENKHLDVISKQRPNIVIVKKPQQCTSDFQREVGHDVRVDKDFVQDFEEWTRFTTGTCVLACLAANLKNARVRCYGFQDEEDWERYMATDGVKYIGVKDQERRVMLTSIKRLEALQITKPCNGIPKVIVIPIKKSSTGAPGKNAILIRHCINEVLKCQLPIHIVGDDVDLMATLKDEYGDMIQTSVIHIESPTSDVTDTLRQWADESNYCGNMALVQCTSPYLKHEWVMKCLDALSCAPIAATACEMDFKPTAIFKIDANGFYTPYNESMPPASVARQLLPKTIRINGAVVAFHTDCLMHESLFQGGAMEAIIVTKEESLDVDTQSDLKKAIEVINK